MTDREKLIELLVQECREAAEEEGTLSCCQDYCDERKESCCGGVTDRLIANGVTVQKRGEWIFCSSHGEDEFEQKCSVCGDYANMRYSYCPNCGADMSHKETGNV